MLIDIITTIEYQKNSAVGMKNECRFLVSLTTMHKVSSNLTSTIRRESHVNLIKRGKYTDGISYQKCKYQAVVNSVNFLID